MRLMERHGFKKVGEIKEVGRKFDRWLDVTFQERILPD
jgi:L-amino acid N-acyltransferase YncA